MSTKWAAHGPMLNNTIQDVLLRRARKCREKCLWFRNRFSASIATETKVVNMLKDQGIDKKSLTREEFLAHALEMKENTAESYSKQ